MKARGGLAAILLLSSVPAHAATWNATDANFKSVFAKARSGDTIRLSGNFNRIALSDRTFTGTLTIDARAARFYDTLSFSNVSGIQINGGTYGSALRTVGPGIRISGGSRFNISAPIVLGNGTSSHGISVGGTSNITVDRGTFSGLRLGIGFTSVTNGKMTNNKSTRSTSDGFNVADSHNVLVSRNSCSGTAITPGSHPDCVQLWSIKGRPVQSDIEISDNTATGATQGFTSFNGKDGGGLRISMLRNRVDTSYPQGVACYECVDSKFIGNILTTQAGAQWQTSLNVVGGRNNTISGNSVGKLGAKKLTGQAVSAFTVLADTSEYDGFTDFDEFAGLDALGEAGLGASPNYALSGLDTPSSALAIAAIPEPASWLLMIAGFGLVGAATRRRRMVAA